MEMVAHENVSIEAEMLALLVGRNELEVLLVVRCFFEDLLPLVAAGDDVVESAGIFDAGLRGMQ